MNKYKVEVRPAYGLPSVGIHGNMVHEIEARYFDVTDGKVLNLFDEEGVTIASFNEWVHVIKVK